MAATSEAFRREVAGRIDEVLASTVPGFRVAFPSCISAAERKYIHLVAEQFGLKHDSRGKGDARHITVWRDAEKLSRRHGSAQDGLGAPRLRLPPAAWEALDHPLLRHAARGGNTEALHRASPAVAVSAEEAEQLLGGPGRQRQRAPVPSSASGQGPPQTPLLATRRALPSWASRDAVLAAVKGAAVTLILGETGCGKSTQVPQFLLEEDAAASIVVTQPRRLSALAVAHRVAQERAEEVGQTVGYSVHLESASSAATRLLFCTTGVFRRRMLADPFLTGVTHLVLDELHERDKITDFLLVAVRELLEERPEMRLVLMSATMQHEIFLAYFPGAAVVSVEGRTFPVEERYLEDFAPELHAAGYWKMLGPGFAAGGRGFGSWGNNGAEKTFKYQVLVSHIRDADGLCGFGGEARRPLVAPRLEEAVWLHDVLQQTKGLQFDLPIVEALLEWLVKKDGPTKSGGILVFVPGWDDIDRLKRRLRQHAVLGDPGRFKVLQLHSQIRLEQQKEVFQRPPKGVRKIVLSTNIAEASITVDDIEVVIDCGRAKETSYDAFLRVPTLNTSWISRASASQRAGRAGRVAPGICYHLFSRRRLELMEAHRLPEMLRAGLEDVCLHTRLVLLRRGQSHVSTEEYLSRAPSPPEPRHVRGAEGLLQDLGALLPSLAEVQGDGTEAGAAGLTALGCHLSVMPLSPGLAKLALLGAMLGVGEEVLSIVAGLQYREPFVSLGDGLKPMTLAEANTSVRRAKRQLCEPVLSDHVALVRACEGFEAARGLGGDRARTFCDEFSLSWRSMQTLQQTTRRLQSELRQRSLWCSEHATRNRGSAALLSAALAAGLFPNIASRPKAAGSCSKLLANGGRLEAVPHPSSVFAFAEGGRGATASQRRGEGDTHEDGLGTSWFCFSELSQVEDHYSLSGVTPVATSAMLLLCGEGDLTLHPTPESGDASEGGDVEDVFERWWADAAIGGDASGDGSATEGDVVVTIEELGEWFSVRMTRKSAEKLQALRAMVRLLFRAFCAEPQRWRERVAGGQAGEVVLDLAARFLIASSTVPDDVTRAVHGGGGRTASRPERPEELPATIAQASQESSGRRRGAGAGPSSSAPRAVQRANGSGPGAANGEASSQSMYPSGRSGARSTPPTAEVRPTWPCAACRQQVPAELGQLDAADAQWYCSACWWAYNAEWAAAQPAQSACSATGGRRQPSSYY